jgi:hypothetical protein
MAKPLVVRLLLANTGDRRGSRRGGAREIRLAGAESKVELCRLRLGVLNISVGRLGPVLMLKVYPDRRDRGVPQTWRTTRVAGRGHGEGLPGEGVARPSQALQRR